MVIAAAVFAAPVEQVVSFQGKIVESGVPAEGPRDIHFYIYGVASGGISLWDENHPGVNVVGGLFNVELGAITAFADAGVDFSEQYWVGISVEGGAEIEPRYKLTSSPYAIADGDWVVDGADMYSLPTGNVGIGTTTPAVGLDIYGTQFAGALSDGIVNIGSTSGYHITLDADDIQAKYSSGNSILFLNYYGGDVNIAGGALCAKDAGDVGIGTTVPSVLLDIYGTQDIGSSSDGIVNIGSTSGNHITLDADDIQAKGGSANSILYLNYYGGDVDIAYGALCVKDAGDVGIGTTTPTHKLEVDGDVHITGDLTTDRYTNPALPIAYGFVSFDGTLASGTSNITATSWNAASSCYEITISDEFYFYCDYVTVVTVSDASDYNATTNSGDGDLLVFLHDTAGDPIQNNFQFVIYKP